MKPDGNGEMAAGASSANDRSEFRIRINRSGFWLLGAFFLVLFLIGYVWQPLLKAYLETFNPNYPVWVQIDWLLIGIFLFMSVLLLTGADLRRDIPIMLIGLAGGLVIESWGTQTELWTYYTFERPPLWIIPAWPIAFLSIDRLYRATIKITRLNSSWTEDKLQQVANSDLGRLTDPFASEPVFPVHLSFNGRPIPIPRMSELLS